MVVYYSASGLHSKANETRNDTNFIVVSPEMGCKFVVSFVDVGIV